MHTMARVLVYMHREVHWASSSGASRAGTRDGHTGRGTGTAIVLGGT